MTIHAFINHIETAIPPYEGHQNSIESIPKFVKSEKDAEWLKHIAGKSGIEKRYSVINPIFDIDGSNTSAFYRLDQFPTTAQRMSRYQKEALPLANKAIDRLQTKIDLQTITHLIITSCTGFYAPGLDIDIVNTYQLNPKVERTIIGYMGCYSAITGLKVANAIVRAQKAAKVLMLNIELCTLHLRRNETPLDQLLSFLLFADGCAASIISSDSYGLRLDGFLCVILPESDKLMQWTIGDDGFYMKLDPGIPKIFSAGLQSYQSDMLYGRSPHEFNYWAIHPGGRRLLDTISLTLGLSQHALEDSYHVLKNYGNMSSPTIMFILKRIMDGYDQQGFGCAMAFGPGLSIESSLFHKGNP
ncbi:MAG: type III polyketide synthase [Chlamydiota bacterium]|nr:type III polyketide synthase [Chlamydiota bacterium]